LLAHVSLLVIIDNDDLACRSGCQVIRFQLDGAGLVWPGRSLRLFPQRVRAHDETSAGFEAQQTQRALDEFVDAMVLVDTVIERRPQSTRPVFRYARPRCPEADDGSP